MPGEQEQSCPCCGKAIPCACHVDPRTGTITDPQSRFTLLPLIPDEGVGPAISLEELGVPLVREAKFDVRAPQLGAAEALALEKQVEQLDALIHEERIEEADRLAEDCLARVIRFPEHRPVRMLRWQLLLLGGFTAAALLLYFVVA